MSFSTVKASLKFVAPKKRRNHILRNDCLFLSVLSSRTRQTSSTPAQASPSLAVIELVAGLAKAGTQKPQSPCCLWGRSKVSWGHHDPAVIFSYCPVSGEHSGGLSGSTLHEDHPHRQLGRGCLACPCHLEVLVLPSLPHVPAGPGAAQKSSSLTLVEWETQRARSAEPTLKNLGFECGTEVLSWEKLQLWRES